MFKTSKYDSKQIINEALSGFYRDGSITALEIRKIGNNKHEIIHLFGQYDRVLNSMGHVSANQIQAALIESIYCAFYYSILDKSLETKMSVEDFKNSRGNFILLDQNISFRKMLAEGEKAKIRVHLMTVEKYKIKKNFIKYTFNLFGIVKGQVSCLIPC